MLVAEPPRSRFDVHFRLAGFPVRIHPTFWLTGAILGFAGGGGDTDPIELVIWVAVMLLSILVHELGHALLIRKNGWNSKIILYGLGGLATMESPPSYMSDDEELTPKQKILIYAAGPGAGFLLAAVVIGVLVLLPIHFRVATHNKWDQEPYKTGIWFTHDLDSPVTVAQFRRADPNDVYRVFDKDDPIRGRLREAGRIDQDSQVYKDALAKYAGRRRLAYIISSLLYINIFWGLLNLLPVFPLDGGQITRELMSRKNPRTGLENALLLSVIVAAVVGCLGLLHFGLNISGLFIALMFGMLAFVNYRVLQQVRNMGGFGAGGGEPEGYDPDDWWKR